VKCDSWYHFCLAARRSLTLLEDHPRSIASGLRYGVSAGDTCAGCLPPCESREDHRAISARARRFATRNGRRSQPDSDSDLAKFLESQAPGVLRAAGESAPSST